MSDTLANALSDANRSSTVLQGIAHPPTVNPLAGMGTAMELVQRMQGLDKSQSEQSLGQAYAKAVDPTTGRFDPLLFNQLAAADPRNAYAMKSGIESSETLQGKQTELAMTHNGVVNRALTAALDGDDAGLQSRVLQQSQMLIDAGIPRDRVMAGLLNMPSDPAALRQRLQTLHFQTLAPEQREGIMYGKTGTVTGPGGDLTGYRQYPRGGAVSAPVQQGAPQGQSPEDLNRPVQIGTNPDGSARMGTNRQARNLAEGRDANDNGPASPLGTGRYTPSTGSPLLNPNRPAQQPAAPGATPPASGLTPSSTPSQPPPQPGYTTGQGPATQSAQQTTGTKSAEKFQAIVDQGTKARSQDALLASMASEAQNFRTGKGADLVGDLKKSILGIGAQFGTTFGIDEKKLASQESVTKIANQLADAQGAGSDARLRVSEGANPSQHNTPAGLDLIIRQLRGNADYLRARQQLAAAHSNKADIEGFESKVGANLDPRVFQYERLTPEQRRDYYMGLSDKGTFRKAHDWATKQGALTGGNDQATPSTNGDGRATGY